MKKLIVRLMFLFLVPVWVLAQQDVTGDFQDGILLQQISTDNGTQIQSYPLNGDIQSAGFGYSEVMEMLRSRVASSERENHIETTQNGNDNTLNVVQEGRNNYMEIQQLGNSNLYEGTLKGEENLIHVLQTGHYIRLYQILDGNGMELQVIQEGSRLELIQIETGGNAPAYHVHQRGEGMSLRIEHNQVMLPSP